MATLMSKYKLRQIQGVWLNVKGCEGCERVTTAEYCCVACEAAHKGSYEIHETGILAHSESCDGRHRLRGDQKRNAL